MKTTIGSLMLANAALFFFGAIQHAGVALGPFHEPYIIRELVRYGCTQRPHSAPRPGR